MVLVSSQFKRNLLSMRIAIVTALICFSQFGFAQSGPDDLPEWLSEGISVGVSNRRDNGEMTVLVQPLASRVGASVVQVVCGGRPVALGTIVSSDGYVLTKQSELTTDPIRIRLHDDRLFDARVAAVRKSSDLALIKIDSTQSFTPIQWATDSPQVGSFLISPGRGARTVGIGVVSVLARPVQHQGKLGVHLVDDSDGRALVQTVIRDSGAEQAGVEPYDRIVAINGQSEPSGKSVQKTLSGVYAGESVRLTIERAGTLLEMDATIREIHLMQESENDSKVNGPRNERLSGFERAIQHDTVLDPDECGGPVLDTNGQSIGINIARAGRVVSYALPSSLVVPEMNLLLNEARKSFR
jgi:S1-C subfamily serine protease